MAITFAIDGHFTFEQACTRTGSRHMLPPKHTYIICTKCIIFVMWFIFTHCRTLWGGTDMLNKWSSTIILLSLLITILDLLLRFINILFYSLFIVNISSSITLHWWMVRLHLHMDYFFPQGVTVSKRNNHTTIHMNIAWPKMPMETEETLKHTFNKI